MNIMWANDKFTESLKAYSHLCLALNWTDIKTDLLKKYTHYVSNCVFCNTKLGQNAKPAYLIETRKVVCLTETYGSLTNTFHENILGL